MQFGKMPSHKKMINVKLLGKIAVKTGLICSSICIRVMLEGGEELNGTIMKIILNNQQTGST